MVRTKTKLFDGAGHSSAAWSEVKKDCGAGIRVALHFSRIAAVDLPARRLTTIHDPFVVFSMHGHEIARTGRSAIIAWPDQYKAVIHWPFNGDTAQHEDTAVIQVELKDWNPRSPADVCIGTFSLPIGTGERELMVPLGNDRQNERSSSLPGMTQTVRKAALTLTVAFAPAPAQGTCSIL